MNDPLQLDGDPPRLWWLNPTLIFLGMVGGTLLFAYGCPASVYELYGTPKHLRAHHLVPGFLALAAFVIGSYLGRQAAREPGGAGVPRPGVLDRWFALALALSLFGYIVWMAVGISRGFSWATVRDLLQHEELEQPEYVKFELFATIPGVTTCVQFAIAAAVLGLLCWYQRVRWSGVALAGLMLVTILRAGLLSERLALLEIAVPCCLLGLRLRVMRHGLDQRWWRVWQFAPLAALLAVPVLFGTFEYFRSWRYYRDDYPSFTAFTLTRLLGYYSTAHNNGAMTLDVIGRWPVPYWTWQDLWGFPLVEMSPLAYPQLTGVHPDQVYLHALERYANPEFNNWGGLFMPFVDYGLLGGTVFWLLGGYVAGRLYERFCQGRFSGCLFYPLVYLSILETPRILYLVATRCFPSVVFLFVLWIACQRRAPAAVAGKAPTARTVAEPS